MASKTRNAPVKHSVEAGHLVDTNCRDAANFGDLVHRRKGQKVAALALGEVQQWDHARLNKETAEVGAQQR